MDRASEIKARAGISLPALQPYIRPSSKNLAVAVRIAATVVAAVEAAAAFVALVAVAEGTRPFKVWMPRPDIAVPESVAYVAVALSLESRRMRMIEDRGHGRHPNSGCHLPALLLPIVRA